MTTTNFRDRFDKLPEDMKLEAQRLADQMLSKCAARDARETIRITKDSLPEDHARHVLISGGSRGLGLEIVHKLLREGYHVWTFARKITEDVEDLMDAIGFHFAEIDITDTEAVKNFANQIPQIYAVINNSAIAVDGILASLPEVEIDKMVDVNLISPIKMTRHCLKKMLKANKGGRVVNISSITGIRGYNGLTIYSATKAGLDGFTRSLAREIGRVGITVNSIAPGYMETDLSSGLKTDQMDQIVRRTPTGRLTTLDEVASTVLHLLSEKSANTTGQTIVIDGGITI